MNLRGFANRTKKDQGFGKGIEPHLAHGEDANLARRLSPEEALRQAHLRFGSQPMVRERGWHDRWLPWLSDLTRDFSFAVRALAKTRGFTVIAVLVIAVGIGVNTAVFSVINAVLLKPLTYPNPQELVSLTNTSAEGSFPGASIPKFSLWRQQNSIFQQVAALLFGVRPLDPISFLATPLLLSLVALLSICVPALRATRIDPMNALRIE